jgi:hypothetical protein
VVVAGESTVVAIPYNTKDKMMSPVLLLWLVAAFQTGPVERATVVARDGDLSTPLFTFERTVTTADGRTVAAVQFVDPGGHVVATERVTYVGGEVVAAELEQRQVDERYAMTVSDGDAWFEAVRDGKTSRTRRDWAPDTLTIDQLPSFVTSQWDRLIDGEEVSFRLVALDRGRIVRFRLIHRGETAHRGRPAVALRMEANSMFVRWLAPEVDLVFSPDGRTMLESRGPLPVKVRDGGDWVDLDARLVWDR